MDETSEALGIISWMLSASMMTLMVHDLVPWSGMFIAFFLTPLVAVVVMLIAGIVFEKVMMRLFPYLDKVFPTSRRSDHIITASGTVFAGYLILTGFWQLAVAFLFIEALHITAMRGHAGTWAYWNPLQDYDEQDEQEQSEE